MLGGTAQGRGIRAAVAYYTVLVQLLRRSLEFTSGCNSHECHFQVSFDAQDYEQLACNTL